MVMCNVSHQSFLSALHDGQKTLTCQQIVMREKYTVLATAGNNRLHAIIKILSHLPISNGSEVLTDFAREIELFPKQGLHCHIH